MSVAIYTLRKNTTRDEPATYHDAKSWFGMALVDEQSAPIYACLARWIAATDPYAALQETPVATGFSLLHHLLPAGQSYPQLHFGMQSIIRGKHSIPAHRSERFERPSPGDVTYDARVSWLAHVRNVPVALTGDAVFDNKRVGKTTPKHVLTYIPFRNAFYLVDVTVPTGWDTIGLVPCTDGDGHNPSYPRRPGECWQQWLDSREVKLLIDHGWPHKLRERILFDGEAPGTDPLRKWQEALTMALLSTKLLDTPTATLTPGQTLLRKALRAIAIQTIGPLRGYKSDTFVPDGEAIPAGQTGTPHRVPGGVNFETYAETHDLRGQWSHPEWIAAIWARQRLATTQLILKHQIPLRDIVAIKDDGVTLRKAYPIVDSLRIGGWRLKR